MYNVILNSTCNLRCDYCFADDYMYEEQKASSGDMSEATFYQVVEFLVKSKVPHVSLLGGEPTLHPQFKEIWKSALKYGIHYSLKSNALWSDEMLEFFNNHQDPLYSFHLNINSPAKLSQHQWIRIRNNVLQLKTKNKSFQLNIDSPQFEYDWILSLAKETGVKHLLWSLAAPISSPKPANTFAAQKDFKQEYAIRLEAFLKEAHEAGIRTTGVHGPTPCLISRELLEKIKTIGSSIEGNCDPVYDIFPDKKIHFCFPLKDKLSSPTIDQVCDLWEVGDYLVKDSMVARSLSFPWADCPTCPEALAGTCHGGCLAQKQFKNLMKDDVWENFHSSIPMFTDSLYQADDIFLYRGKPVKETRAMNELLLLTDGKIPLAEIFKDWKTKQPSSSEHALLDRFCLLVGQAVRKKYLFLKPVFRQPSFVG